MIASILRFIREGGETLHPKTVKEMLFALHAIDKRLQDELLEVRVEDMLLGKRLQKERERAEPFSGEDE